MPDHKTKLYKFWRMELIQSMFSDDQGIHLEIRKEKYLENPQVLKVKGHTF